MLILWLLVVLLGLLRATAFSVFLPIELQSLPKMPLFLIILVLIVVVLAAAQVAVPGLPLRIDCLLLLWRRLDCLCGAIRLTLGLIIEPLEEIVVDLHNTIPFAMGLVAASRPTQRSAAVLEHLLSIIVVFFFSIEIIVLVEVVDRALLQATHIVALR